MRIKAQIGYAIAGPDAVRMKRRGQALAAFTELGIGEPFCAGHNPHLLPEQIDAAVGKANRRERNDHGIASVEFWIVRRNGRLVRPSGVVTFETNAPFQDK